MDSDKVNERELSPEARTALAALAEALTEAPQFAAFEAASLRLEADAGAQEALEAYQTECRSLEMLMRLNALSPDQQDELDALKAAVSAQESITAYSEAQGELAGLWQAVTALLSQRIGVDYGAASRVSGCC
jgi:cell fate (sporulation/competence/biofilm development) regulator YlbF (YheA/YmcA/DUF963 family)